MSTRNLKLWLDASNIDGQHNARLAEHAPVVQWTDLSGFGNHMYAPAPPKLVYLATKQKTIATVVGIQPNRPN